MRLLILALLLAGCAAPIEPTQLADGSYRLRFDQSFMVPSSVAPDALKARAEQLCPNGYQRLQERGTGTEFSGFTEWVVRCD